MSANASKPQEKAKGGSKDLPASKFKETETIEPCVGCGQPGGRWGIQCVVDGSNGRARGRLWHHGCQDEAIMASCAAPTVDCSGDPL